MSQKLDERIAAREHPLLQRRYPKRVEPGDSQQSMPSEVHGAYLETLMCAYSTEQRQPPVRRLESQEYVLFSQRRTERKLTHRYQEALQYSM